MSRGAKRKVKRFVHPIIQQLHKERMQRRMTLAQVTELTGLGDDVIGQWERGEQQPKTLERLEWWAGKLGFELVLRRKDEAQ